MATKGLTEVQEEKPQILHLHIQHLELIMESSKRQRVGIVLLHPNFDALSTDSFSLGLALCLHTGFFISCHMILSSLTF